MGGKQKRGQGRDESMMSQGIKHGRPNDRLSAQRSNRLEPRCIGHGSWEGRSWKIEIEA